MTSFKVGDIIARKDMPQLLCKIIGEQKDAWYVETLNKILVKKKALLRGGLVYKDDDRWMKVKR